MTKIHSNNYQLLNSRLRNVSKEKLNSPRVIKISQQFIKRHVIFIRKSEHRNPTIGEVFDDVVPVLMKLLKLHIDKRTHLIAKFIAKVFVDVIG